jgi:hypothetical protein
MDPETLERLGIASQDGKVKGRDFVRLVEGRHPASGEWLRAAGRRRRSWWRDRRVLQRAEVGVGGVGAR